MAEKEKQTQTQELPGKPDELLAALSPDPAYWGVKTNQDQLILARHDQQVLYMTIRNDTIADLTISNPTVKDTHNCEITLSLTRTDPNLPWKIKSGTRSFKHSDSTYRVVHEGNESPVFFMQEGTQTEKPYVDELPEGLKYLANSPTPIWAMAAKALIA